MAIVTTVTQKRGDTIIQTGIGAQIDNKNEEVRAFDGGAAPYDEFDVYIHFGFGLSFARNDVLVDEFSGTGNYLITGRPEPFVNGSIKLLAKQAVGT